MIQYTFFQTGDHSSMSSFDVVAPHRTVSPTNTSVTTDITATRPTTKPAAQYSPDNSTISEGSDSTIAPHYEPHDASIYITSLRHEAPVLAPLRSLGTLKGMVLFISDAFFLHAHLFAALSTREATSDLLYPGLPAKMYEYPLTRGTEADALETIRRQVAELQDQNLHLAQVMLKIKFYE